MVVLLMQIVVYIGLVLFEIPLASRILIPDARLTGIAVGFILVPGFKAHISSCTWSKGQRGARLT